MVTSRWRITVPHHLILDGSPMTDLLVKHIPFLRIILSHWWFNVDFTKVYLTYLKNNHMEPLIRLWSTTSPRMAWLNFSSSDLCPWSKKPVTFPGQVIPTACVYIFVSHSVLWLASFGASRLFRRQADVLLCPSRIRVRFNSSYKKTFRKWIPRWLPFLFIFKKMRKKFTYSYSYTQKHKVGREKMSLVFLVCMWLKIHFLTQGKIFFFYKYKVGFFI